ncbi:MAG: linoleoyl-CoA desaturase [Gaiellaceae bacterium]|nr:linoleoyl-CoA desaturase [Gaiellaceae bacterium]
MNAPARKLSFDNGGDFILETRREVEAYLAPRRIRIAGSLQLYAKTVVALSIWAASWVSIVFVRPGIALTLLALGGLVLGTVLIGFCVQHDANHGAYFRTRRNNHLMGWSADALLGFSSYAWRVKHNVAHHTYTNVDGYDDDISQTPFARLMPSQEPKPWYRLQHIYIWPLYSVMVIRWQTGADIAALVRRRIGRSAIHMPKRWDLAGLLSGKALFIGWAIVAPLLVYPWWVVAAGYVGFTMATSLITATTFQLAHCVEEAAFTSPEELEAEKRIWAVHEVETTVDFCPRNPVLTWMLGGLNYQIEHHLFPRVSHIHYPRIAEIVRRNALKHGVRYTAQPTLWVALRSHHRHLRTLGRLGVPVEIEMG